MTEKQKTRLNELLTKLKKAHDVYKACTEVQKEKLFNNCDWIIDELVTFGRDRTFYEALLMYGMEFLLAEYGDEEEKIFGAFKQDLTEEEQKEVDQMTSQGVLAWEKSPDGKLKPLIYRKNPTMDEAREREKAAQLSLSELPGSVK